MLRQDINELLTRTGPKTPMGELFRQYWMPACLAEELPENPAAGAGRRGAAELHQLRSGGRGGVARAASVPVLGGFGGGPWLDGRMRMAHAAIGYAAAAVDKPPDTYANVARTTLDVLTRYADDVRSARQLPGGIPVPPAL